MPEADRHLLSAAARVVLRGDLGELRAAARSKGALAVAGGDRPAIERAAGADRQPRTPVPIGPPRHGERHRRLHARRARIRDRRSKAIARRRCPGRTCWRTPTSARWSATSGAAFTWAGEQPREPAHAVRQRSGQRSDGRSDLPARRRRQATSGAPRRGRCHAGRFAAAGSIRHGAGVTRFQHASTGSQQELAVCVAPDDPVKLSLLTLTNTRSAPRRLSVFGYVEWALGPPRAGERRFVVTERDEPDRRDLVARNAYNTEFKDRVAFWHATEPVASFTCDRARLHRPQSDARSAGRPVPRQLGGQRRRRPRSVRRAAGQRSSSRPGESRRVAFVLGQGAMRRTPRRSRRSTRTSPDVRRGARPLRPSSGTDTLGAVQVQTPDDSFDLLVNRWLLYQALSCRIWARSGPYQPGGAFGFRDQLQDVLALLYTRPDLCREHICCCAAARQFVEGDVQHWWHPPSGRGTRTRCSDDLLWLPYAAAHLRRADRRSSAARRAGRRSWKRRRSSPSSTRCTTCRRSRRDRDRLRACDPRHRSLAEVRRPRTAADRLGDWNDGMNRVGHEGAAKASGSAGSCSSF